MRIHDKFKNFTLIQLVARRSSTRRWNLSLSTNTTLLLFLYIASVVEYQLYPFHCTSQTGTGSCMCRRHLSRDPINIAIIVRGGPIYGLLLHFFFKSYLCNGTQALPKTTVGSPSYFSSSRPQTDVKRCLVQNYRSCVGSTKVKETLLTATR